MDRSIIYLFINSIHFDPCKFNSVRSFATSIIIQDLSNSTFCAIFSTKLWGYLCNLALQLAALSSSIIAGPQDWANDNLQNEHIKSYYIVIDIQFLVWNKKIYDYNYAQSLILNDHTIILWCFYDSTTFCTPSTLLMTTCICF